LRLRKSGKRSYVLLLIVVIPLLLIAWQFRLPPAPPDLPANYHAEKAVWLEISWAMDSHDDSEIAELAQNLQNHHITTVFAYVSYLKPGDLFNPTYDHAAEFVRRFHAASPNLRLLAWVGVPIAITSPAGEIISNRLENASTRSVIAAFARQMVIDNGFDGIHLNAEAIPNGDSAFIQTLQTIRNALPDKAILSTTAHALRLTKSVTIMPYPVLAHSWSTDYLRLVAENSDQIAIMAYDSGLFFPSDYREWVKYQVETSATALKGLNIDFLVGVPASEEWTLSHNTTSEYLANALYGVQAGLAESDTPGNIDGIAVYPHWEIDASEWALLDKFP
jgi:spore germination protein YaaH